MQKGSIEHAAGITSQWIDFKSYQVKLIKPQGRPAGVKLPAVLYVHGGGWVYGSPDAFGFLMAELATRVNAAIFAVHYTRSPEAKYPTALDQTWDTFNYIEAHGQEHDV